ncbi:MAG: lipid-A-disaccharide synthase [Flavipsychrobacter sp.]
MRYYIIAGEASGDLHGSNLIKAIHNIDASAAIRCWGGEKMQEAGANLVKHYRDLAFMGFVEVLLHIRTIFKNISFCKEDIAAFEPDVLVLIDYPGFNMRIATWARQQGIKIVYYISPQVWAWKANRVKKLKRDVDEMLVILPFEVDYYKEKWQYDVTYVGHPLIEVIEHEKSTPATPLSNKPIIALLPGSRSQEIKIKLPIMLLMVDKFPDYQFAIAQAPSQDSALYEEIIGDKNVILVPDQTYNLLKQSSAALVTSGTATLETALFGVPEVVCYKGNPISYWIATKLVDIKYISLVNLIMDKEVIKELIQADLNEKLLFENLDKLLNNNAYKAELMQDYRALWDKLGKEKASLNAAKKVVNIATMNNDN